jgi:hypothetical protein
MKKTIQMALVALAIFGIPGSAFAQDNIKIDFKQIRGPKPQAPLVVVDADMTPLAQKQLDKILAEGGMLETATYKQSAGMSASSAFWEFKLAVNGKTHEARIDEQQAPTAYLKLVKFVQKYGHKLPEDTAKETQADSDEPAKSTTDDKKDPPPASSASASETK